MNKNKFRFYVALLVIVASMMVLTGCTQHCEVDGCSNEVEEGSKYCEIHMCKIDDCKNRTEEEYSYCLVHKCAEDKCNSLHLSEYEYCILHLRKEIPYEWYKYRFEKCVESATNEFTETKHLEFELEDDTSTPYIYSIKDEYSLLWLCKFFDNGYVLMTTEDIINGGNNDSLATIFGVIVGEFGNIGDGEKLADIINNLQRNQKKEYNGNSMHYSIEKDAKGSLYIFATER